MIREATRRQTLGAAIGVTLVAGCAIQRFAKGNDMERVEGIGGFFFRARDPALLGSWYAEKLGVALAPQSYDAQPWTTQAGVTIFSPFEQQSDYFGRAEQQWMINFRVRNLDAMVAQLRAGDIAVEVDAESYPNGRFARLSDPEGNPIQLWEPVG